MEITENFDSDEDSRSSAQPPDETISEPLILVSALTEVAKFRTI